MKKLFNKGFLTSVAAVMMAVVMAFGLLVLANPTIVYANNDIIVTIDGVVVDFEGQPPTIVGGRTLVPVRGVFEALGFDVDFDFTSDTRQVFLTRDTDDIVITIGSAVFTNNGISYTLDVPAQIIGGRTLLPIRAVLESVGYNLDWVSTTRTVIITTLDHTPEPDEPEAPESSQVVVRMLPGTGNYYAVWYPEEDSDIGTFYNIVERHTDAAGTVTVRTNTGHQVRIDLNRAVVGTMSPGGTNFDGNITGFRVTLNTLEYRGEIVRDLTMYAGHNLSSEGGDIEGHVNGMRITTGNAIIEVTTPDGVNLGQFMVGDGGCILITGLQPGVHRITLIQAPRGFTMNVFPEHGSLDAQGRPFIDVTVREGTFVGPGFVLVAE